MPRNILLVDDDESVADLVRLTFEINRGFRLLWVDNPSRVLSQLKSNSIDLVLLDYAMPQVDGRDVLKDIRADHVAGGTPVIMLTAREDESLVTRCLDDGADDFVFKPWRENELLARMNSLLRRREFDGRTKQLLKVGSVSLDTELRALTVDGESVRLTPTEFVLLHALMKERGRILEKRRILKDLWGHSVPEYENIHTRTLDTHIQNLRKKIAPHGDFIHTVPGVGYRFERAKKPSR